MPFTFVEPQIGYLKTLVWTDEVTLNGTNANLGSVTKYVSAMMKARGIPGAAVLVMEDDKVVYRQGFGYANLTTLQPFTAGTASRCGSISKTACALAALRLVNQGKLSLDDSILSILDPKIKATEHLPGWEKIRVRDLMDHASGLKNNSTYLTSHKIATEMGKKMRLSLRDLFNYVKQNVPVEGGRTSYSYCNLNFELLSLIIEVKTGRPFGDALQTLVVKPLGIPSNQMFLSPTSLTPPGGSDNTNAEARCYQKSPKTYENIFAEGSRIPEAYGGLDGDILSGAGHIAFSTEAICKMVQTLRSRPTTFLKKSNWDDLLTPPEYASLPVSGGYSKDTFYSKGTVVSQSATGPTFAHGAMLMHAGGFYQPYKDTIEFVVISNCNMRSGTFVDGLLVNAVKKGLAEAGK